MTTDLQRTYDILNTGTPLPAWFHTLAEWLEIYTITPLQIEHVVDKHGNSILHVFAAALDAGYIASGEHTHDSLEDDMYFEVTHEGMKR